MRVLLPALSLLLATVVLAADLRPPSEIYGELFERIQLERIYPDSKNFVDALPVKAPEEVLADYRAQRGHARSWPTNARQSVVTKNDRS